MKKQGIVLVIAGIATLAAGSVYAIGSAANHPFLGEASTREYVATIDKNNRLILKEDGGYMAAFRLHAGSEYGMVSFRAYDSHVGHYLVDEDSDYAFTWNSTWHYGFDIYFVDLQQRSIEKVGNDRYYDRDVNGKRASLRGFPSRD